MKNRYILLTLFLIFSLYLLWCNISIIYTRKGKVNIPLVENVQFPSDSFDVVNATVFWQGFYHDWSYNHRVNRIGDWIDNVSNKDGSMRAVFTHTAASGSGADVLNYLTFFTYLKTEKAQFFSAATTATIRGREATTTTKVIAVKGKWPSSLAHYKMGTVVLNGFDLYSSNSNNGKVMGSGNADKLSKLFMEVNNFKIQDSTFEFDLNVMLGADCDSPECLNFTPGDNEWFDYQLKVAYQIIAYQDDVHVSNAKLQQDYTWRKPFKTRPDIDPNEIFRKDKVLENQVLKGHKDYHVGIPLISKIDINLPKGKGGVIRKRMETPHLLALDIAINDYEYNPATGNCVYTADLFFKNWKPNMHILSFGNDGRAIINLGIKFLQIRDPNAVVESQFVKGDIKWQTTQLDQRLANDPHSQKSFVLQK